MGGGSTSAAIAIGYAISRTKDTQFHKSNRLWQPGRLTGHSPDTRRILAGDNFASCHSTGREAR